jgi:glycosyltransferase involved in cell wall biosynthesis
MLTQRKLLILSNGLRDQVGHYFETSISVADAARNLGLRPILATHVDCRRELLPEWLESHSLFRTDHWMCEPPAADARTLCVRQSWAERLWRNCQSAWPTGRRAMWLANRGAYFLLPPLFYDLGRLVAYCCVPRIVLPDARARATTTLRRLTLKIRHSDRAPLVEQASAWPLLAQAIASPSAPPTLIEAADRLLPVGLGQELEYALLFYEDLERFLAIAKAGPADHVWLGTAHAREVLAVRLVVERMGNARAPTFHLEFRHAPFDCDAASGGPVESPQTRLQRSFLSLYAERGCTDRIRFYTDSGRLSEDYESLVDLPFGVLPLPFRAKMISRTERRPGEPVTIAYLGEARDEKGFHWLPPLVEALADDDLLPGKARFLIQSNVSQPRHNPRSCEALRRLKRRPRDGVELVSPDGALSPEDYYSLVSRADLVLLPYAPGIYRSRTSGALGEALAAGAAVVVPSGTWLADQLPPGCGETFDDFDGFLAAVKRVVGKIDSYATAAQRFQRDWRQRHSPERLVEALLGQTARAAAAA